MDYSGYNWLSGTALAANGDADKTLIAAQTGKPIRVLSGTINVTVAATGTGGLVALEDGAGGTVIWQADANAVGGHRVDFGPLGYPLTAGNALNLTVDGAVTTQASARATITAFA